MANIPTSFNFGDTNDITIEELVVKLQRMYYDLAESINGKPDLYVRESDGQSNDVFLSDGSININTNTNKVEMLTKHNSTTNVTWTTLS